VRNQLRDRFGGEATGRKIESLEDGIATSLRDAIRRVRETNKRSDTPQGRNEEWGGDIP